MSYILDALKKLESDKEKKNRTTGVVNISGELLRTSETRRSPRTAVWPRIVFVALIVVLLGGSAAWWLQRSSGPKKKTGRLDTIASPVVPPTPAPVVTPPLQVQPPAAPMPTPQSQAATSAPPAAVTPPAPTTTAGADTAGDDEDDASNRRRRARHGTRTERKPAEPAAQATLVAAPTEIKVSGIAWQEERAARRAVINGYLMREGGVVAGATITEIKPDKVRFKGASGVFEIPLLAAGALSGAGK